MLEIVKANPFPFLFLEFYVFTRPFKAPASKETAFCFNFESWNNIENFRVQTTEHKMQMCVGTLTTLLGA